MSWGWSGKGSKSTTTTTTTTTTTDSTSSTTTSSTTDPTTSTNTTTTSTDSTSSPSTSTTTTTTSSPSSTTTSTPTVSGSIALSCKLSRASGKVPLAVWVDCAGTKNGGSYPWHEVKYTVNFGDTEGTFSTGARAGVASTNVMYGPLAAHVYESAGTYNITVTATDSTGMVTSSAGTWSDGSNGQITASAFANDATAICFSTTTDFTGCPGNASHTQTSSLDTAINTAGSGSKTQLYFHGGQTFTTSGGVTISTAGPGIVASFGSGRATLAATSTTATVISTGTNDWRFNNLIVNGAGSTAGNGMWVTKTQITVSNSTFNNHSYSIISPTGGNSQLMMYKDTIQNMSSVSGGGSSYAAFIQMDDSLSTKYAAVLGNTAILDNPSLTTSHLYRFLSAHYVVFSDNTLDNQYGYQPLKWVAVPYDHAGAETEYLIASDNKTLDGKWEVETGGNCGGCSTTEVMHDIIIERNWWAGINEALDLGASYVTVRNNVWDLGTSAGGWSFTIRHTWPQYTPTPDYVWVYNNSFYKGGSEPNDIGAINLGDNQNAGALGHVFVKNNLVYFNSAPNAMVIRNAVGSNITLSESNNTCGIGNYIEGSKTNCKSNFTVNPYTGVSPFNPTNAKPAAGSYSIDNGASVPAWSDFFQSAWSSSWDIGAVRH